MDSARWGRRLGDGFLADEVVNVDKNESPPSSSSSGSNSWFKLLPNSMTLSSSSLPMSIASCHSSRPDEFDDEEDDCDDD